MRVLIALILSLCMVSSCFAEAITFEIVKADRVGKKVDITYLINGVERGISFNTDTIDDYIKNNLNEFVILALVIKFYKDKDVSFSTISNLKRKLVIDFSKSASQWVSVQ
jgi:hypothetical protein